MPETGPPLTKLEKAVFTERTFETILERGIMPQVSSALSVAWPLSYLNREDIAEIVNGDKARRGTMEEDDRFYADWAGVRESQKTAFSYKNLCPGETKLASKWRTSKKGRRRTDYLIPFSQTQTSATIEASKGLPEAVAKQTAIRARNPSWTTTISAERPAFRLYLERPACPRCNESFLQHTRCEL